MTRKKSDDAVSPVIGVMLMLVVVIVVGAVVTVFATGLVGDTKVAPVAKLEVEIISDEVVYGTAPNGYVMYQGTAPTLHLTHVSGDPVDTADLKLSFAWECNNPSCTVKHHTSTYQYSEEFGYAYDTNGGGVQGAFGLDYATEIYVPANYGAYIQPLYINYGLGAENVYDGDGAYFGDHVLKRGETMMAYDLHLIVPRDGTKHAGNPAMDALFNNGHIDCEMVYSGVPVVKCPRCGEAIETDGTGDCLSCQEAMYEEEGEDYFYEHYSETVVPCPECGLIYDDILKMDVTTWNSGVCSECGKTLASLALRNSDGYSAGIMACLPEGTPVNVMITHIPSGQVIYEQKVFVE